MPATMMSIDRVWSVRRSYKKPMSPDMRCVCGVRDDTHISVLATAIVESTLRTRNRLSDASP